MAVIDTRAQTGELMFLLSALGEGVAGITGETERRQIQEQARQMVLANPQGVAIAMRDDPTIRDTMIKQGIPEQFLDTALATNPLTYDEALGRELIRKGQPGREADVRGRELDVRGAQAEAAIPTATVAQRSAEEALRLGLPETEVRVQLNTLASLQAKTALELQAVTEYSDWLFNNANEQQYRDGMMALANPGGLSAMMQRTAFGFEQQRINLDERRVRLMENAAALEAALLASAGPGGINFEAKQKEFTLRKGYLDELDGIAERLLEGQAEGNFRPNEIEALQARYNDLVDDYASIWSMDTVSVLSGIERRIGSSLRGVKFELVPPHIRIAQNIIEGGGLTMEDVINSPSTSQDDVRKIQELVDRLSQTSGTDSLERLAERAMSGGLSAVPEFGQDTLPPPRPTGLVGGMTSTPNMAAEAEASNQMARQSAIRQKTASLREARIMLQEAQNYTGRDTTRNRGDVLRLQDEIKLLERQLSELGVRP